MCKRDLELQLCSCGDNSTKAIQNLYVEEIKALKRKETLQVFGWTLERYIGEEWIGADGLMYMPVDKLTDELTEDFFLEELNGNKCFDFEYIPGEGDNLIFELRWTFNRRGHLKKNAIGGFISFIFKDQEWTADCYNCFYDKTEFVQEGVLKVNVL